VFFGGLSPNRTASFPLSGGFVEQRF